MSNHRPFRHTAARVLPWLCHLPSALLGLSSATRADDTSADLPVMTVTARRDVPSTLPIIEEARVELETIPGGANVVDAGQYREGRVSTLSDALAYSPGVFVASRFGAEESRLSIRGSGLQRTFHMRGITLLQDGVPLNLADGSVDFQAVEPLASRYIAVYRGANALRYGSTTLGGAIDFVSPSGRDGAPASLRAEGGSFGYGRLQAIVVGEGETIDGLFGAAGFHQDGFRDHSQQSTQRLSGNLGWRISDAIETRFFGAFVHTVSELPGALTAAEMSLDPRRADLAAVSGDQHRDFDLYRVSNLTSVAFGGGQRLDVGIWWSYKSLFHPIYQVLEQRSHDYGLSLRYRGGARGSDGPTRWVLGAHLQRGTLVDDRFQNIAGQLGTRTAASEQASRNNILYGELQYDIIPRTTLVLGAQYVDASRELLDKYLSDGTDNGVSQHYQRGVPKIGLRFQIASEAQVYGNWSGSFEPPSFGELAGGPNVTPVDAQHANTVEIGSRGRAVNGGLAMNWDVSLYHAAVRDELLALTDAHGNPLGTVNADRTLHQGVEAGVEATLWGRWMLRASYQLNDFCFDGDAVYGDNALAGVPRQFLAAELLYTLSNGMYFGPNLRAASSSWIDHANTLKTSGYGVLGIKAGQRLADGLSWFAEVRNAGDRTYAATTNVVANARGMDQRAFYPGDGRAWYAGLEYNLR